jgi:uncharacterized protein (TIGR03067 family)
MMRVLSLTVALSLAVFACKPAPGPQQDVKKEHQDPGKEELTKLQGKWKVASWEMNGYPQQLPYVSEVEIQQDSMTSFQNGSAVRSPPIRLKFDPTVSPKTVDLIQTDPGRNNLEVIGLGVYELTGDTLTICKPYNEGGARPPSIAPTDRKGLDIIVYKRVNK